MLAALLIGGALLVAIALFALRKSPAKQLPAPVPEQPAEPISPVTEEPPVMSQLLTLPLSRASNANGTVLSGAKMYSYVTGTTTPQDVYTTSALNVAHANPVIAASDGLFPSIFLDPALIYRFVIKTSADVAIAGMDFDPVSAMDSGSLTFTQTGTGAVESDLTAALHNALPFTPEQFGATGDGSTNDNAAFVALSNAVEANNGGRIVMNPGAIYRVGSQAAGGGYYLRGIAVLDFANIASVEIEGNGATIKDLDNFKYGTFNTGTGAPQDYGSPYSVAANAAYSNVHIQCINVAKVKISGLNLNGNSAGHVIGGRYADTGRQLIHIGIYTSGCTQVEIDNVDSSYFLQDGFVNVQPGLTTSSAARPLIMNNCTSSYCGRNSMSHVGGNKTQTNNCVFSFAGEAPATVTVPSSAIYVSTSPASCWDDEAESSIIRNVTHNASSFISGANTNTAYVADSGDSADITLDKCIVNGVLWLKKERCKVYNSVINGTLQLKGAYSDARSNTLIKGCTISDVPVSPDTAYSGHLLDLEGGGAGIRLEDCTIKVTTTTLNLRSSQLTNVSIDWTTGTGALADLGRAVALNGATVRNLTITSNIATGIPATGYYIELPYEQYGANLIAATSKLKWINGSTGYVGKLANVRYAAYDHATDVLANSVADIAIIFEVIVSGSSAQLLATYNPLPAGMRVIGARATNTTDGFISIMNTTGSTITAATITAGEIKVTEVGAG